MSDSEAATRRLKLLAAVSVLGVSLGMGAVTAAQAADASGLQSDQHKGQLPQNSLKIDTTEKTIPSTQTSLKQNSLKLDAGVTSQKVNTPDLTSNQHKATSPGAGAPSN